MADEPAPKPGDDPPGDMSNQNREEPSAPHPAAGGSAPSEPADDSHPPDSERSSQREEGTPGGAGEGSQATGHPGNAG
jgi:hypothetical protein